MSLASTFFTAAAAAAAAAAESTNEMSTTSKTTATATATTPTATGLPSVTKMAEALITTSLIALKPESESKLETKPSLENLTALKPAALRKTKAESTSCTNNNDNNFDNSKDCLISENETRKSHRVLEKTFSPNFKKRRKQTTPIRISNDSENESENRDEMECRRRISDSQSAGQLQLNELNYLQNIETSKRNDNVFDSEENGADGSETYSNNNKCNDEDNNDNNNEQSNQNNYNNCSYTSEELLAIFHESLNSNLEMCSNKSLNNCDDENMLEDQRSVKSNFPNWLPDEIAGVDVSGVMPNETDGGGNQKIASTIFGLYQQELQLKQQQSKMQTSASTSSDSSTKHFNPESYCEFCNKEFCNKYFLKTHKANKHKIFKESTSSEREFEQTFLQTLPKNFLETNSTLAAIKREDQFSCSDNSSEGVGEMNESLKQFPQQKSHPHKPQDHQQQTSFVSIAKKNNHNSDTFCEFCSKEYCNKYFLRTHKLKRHRTSMTSFMSSSNVNAEIGEIESQVHKQLETLMQTSPLNLMVNSLKSEFQPEPKLHDEHEKSFEEKLSNEASSMNVHENQIQDSIGKNLQKLQTMITELNESDLICKFCKKKFESKNDLQIHLVNEHESSIQNIGSLAFQQQQVQKISQRLQSSSLMPPLTPTQSVNALNTSESVTESIPIPLSSDTQFQTYCRFCDAQFACFEEFKMHQNDCTNSISNLQTNRFHVKMENINEEKKLMLTPTPTPTSTSTSTSINSYCKICQKDLCNKYFMKTHMQRMHNIEIDNGTQIGGVVCDICNKELCSKYFLKVHKNNTHGINDDQSLSTAVAAAAIPTATTSNIMGSLSGDAQIQNQLIERLQRALPSEDQLRSLQLQYDHPPNSTFDNSGNFYELSTKYHNNFNEVCPICQKRFRNSKWLKIHLMSEHCQSTNGFGSQSLLAQPQSLSSILSLKIPSNFSANKSFTTTITGTTTKLATVTSSASATKATTLSPKSAHSLSGIQYLQKNQSRNYVCSYCSFETKILSLLLAHEKSHYQFQSNRSTDNFSCPKDEPIATTITSQSLSLDAESVSEEKSVQFSSDSSLPFRSNTSQQFTIRNNPSDNSNVRNLAQCKKRKMDNNIEYNDSNVNNNTDNSSRNVNDLIANMDATQLLQMTSNYQLPSSYAFPKLISLPFDNYLMQKFLMYELKENRAKSSKSKQQETDSDTEPAANSNSDSESEPEPPCQPDDRKYDDDRNEIEMCNQNPDQNDYNMPENNIKKTTLNMHSFENGAPDEQPQSEPQSQPQSDESDKNQSVLPSIVYLPVFNKISKPITLQISLNPV